MDGLEKLVGVYLVVVAVVVAVFFVINNFLVDSLDVLSVWYVLDVLMLIGLALALIFNYASMREEGGRGEAVTLRYLEVNVAFFGTAGVTILFLHNWLSLLALGPGSLDGNHQAWVSGRRWTRYCRWSWGSRAVASGGNPPARRPTMSAQQLPLALGALLLSGIRLLAGSWHPWGGIVFSA